MIGAVLARNVIKNELAPGVVKVNVDIGHRNAVGIQKAFEKEVVLDRVDVRNTERVRDRRTRRRAAPGADPYAALFASGADIVVNDKKVPGESHRADCIELELDALLDLVRKLFAPAPLRARPDERSEILRLELDSDNLVVTAELIDAPGRIHVGQSRLVILFLRSLFGAETRGNVELRHDRIGIELIFLYSVGDLERIVDKLGIFGEKPTHVLLALEPLFARVDHSLRVAHLRARRKREQHVMGIVVVLFEKVDVVRRDHADIEFFAELEHSLYDLDLALVEIAEIVARLKRNVIAELGRLVKHHFKRIIIAEKILIPLRYAFRLGHVAVVDGARNFTRDARRRAVKTFVIFLQKRVVDTRVMVKAVDMRGRNELYEIMITRQIFGVKA